MAAKIDQEKCNGCGKCVAVCPQEAISIVDKTAVIDTDRCVECGICYNTCPYGAIYAGTEPVQPIPQNQNAGIFTPGTGRGRGLGMRRGRGAGKGPRDSRGRGRSGGGRR
ncbi:MAG: 4Fe-4S binding protein [Spirochaetales bacterium]|nr:4Fe-4S binding protein [Spirochaetales bacterium]